MHMMCELAPRTEGSVSTLRTTPSKSFAMLRVVPQAIEIAGQPSRTFDSYQFHHLKTGGPKFGRKFFRPMKNGIGEVERIAGGVAMLTLFQIAGQDRREGRVVEESVRQRIE
jgi:hypothetical protein